MECTYVPESTGCPFLCEPLSQLAAWRPDGQEPRAWRSSSTMRSYSWNGPNKSVAARLATFTHLTRHPRRCMPALGVSATDKRPPSVDMAECAISGVGDRFDRHSVLKTTTTIDHHPSDGTIHVSSAYSRSVFSGSIVCAAVAAARRRVASLHPTSRRPGRNCTGFGHGAKGFGLAHWTADNCATPVDRCGMGSHRSCRCRNHHSAMVGVDAWRAEFLSGIPKVLGSSAATLTAYQDTTGFWQHWFRYDAELNPSPSSMPRGWQPY